MFVFVVIYGEADGTILDIVGIYATRERAMRRCAQAETRPGIPNLNYWIEEKEVEGTDAYTPPF